MKNYVRLIFSLLIATSSYAKTALYESIDISVSKHILSNGLTVLISEDHKAPIVAVNVMYKVGSRNEPVGYRGFAHLFEHLLYQGSENFNDDFFKATEQLGATDINGNTWFDRTNYFQTVPKNALDSILWLESDRMGHFEKSISQSRLDEQRNVVLNEMKQRENIPYQGILQSHLQESVYPVGHPYSWSPIGSKEDLERASIETVRQWFHDYYGPNNAIVTIVGDVDTKEALKKVTYYFGDIPASKKPFENKVWVAKRSEQKRDVAYDQVPLPRIYKVWNIPGMTNDTIDTYNFLQYVLASGKNSLLYKKLIIDQELASDLGAAVLPTKMGALFIVSVTAKPNVTLTTIEKVIDQALEEVSKKDISKELLETIKTEQYLDTINQLEKIGGSQGKAYILAMFEHQTGDATNYKSSFERFISTKPDDLSKITTDWLIGHDYTLEIHPLPTYSVENTNAPRDKFPLPTEVLDVKFPTIEEATLSNGIKVKHIQRKSIPQMQAYILLHGGSAQDPIGQEGITSMMMDNLSERTSRYTTLKLEQKLASMGAKISAFCDNLFHGLGIASLDQNFDKTMQIASDMLTNPTFSAKEFNRLKSQTVEAFAKIQANPSHLSQMLYIEKSFGKNHPLAHPTIGTISSVQKLELEDIKKAYQTSVTPSQATIFTVGNMKLDEVITILNQTFGRWKQNEAPTLRAIPQVQPQNVVFYLVHKPYATQTSIAGGYILDRGTPEFNAYTSSVFGALSSEFTSRINLNLREEKAWSYGVHSTLWNYDKQALYAIRGNIQTDKTVDAVKEILKEMKQIQTNKPITQKEFTTLIQKRILSLGGTWETNASVIGYAIDQFENGYPNTFLQTYPELLRSLTLTKTHEQTAKVVLPNKLVWVLVGDQSQIEKTLRDARLGQVIVIDADGNPIN